VPSNPPTRPTIEEQTMTGRTIGAALALALALNACADPSVQSGSIPHPVGADQLVLRVDVQGGFVPIEYTFTAIPSFSLFGDGRLIRPGAQIEIYPGPALPAIGTVQLDEEQVQAILRAALDAGLDHDATYDDLGSLGIADAATTALTFAVNGHTYRTDAYALGMEGATKPAGMPQRDWEARRAFQRFTERLIDLSWLPGTIPSEQPYEGEAARLLVGPYSGRADLPQTATPWPTSTPLRTIGEPYAQMGDGWRCGVLDGSEWSVARASASSATQLTPWISAGDRSTVVFRPLLPDESDC
jgi:hypothetical protein